MFDSFEAAPLVPKWSVSTLVPGLRGRPAYRYFETSAEALDYARGRARSGPTLKAGGRAYFVMGYGLDAAGGSAKYRVFRAVQQLEARHGTATKSRQEYVVVHRNAGTTTFRTSDDRTRWVFDKSLSVEIMPAPEPPGIQTVPKPRLKLPGER
jgi:hypothetical protein